MKAALIKDFNSQLAYYNYLKNYKYEYYMPLAEDEQECTTFLKMADEMEKRYSPGGGAPVPELSPGDSTQP